MKKLLFFCVVLFLFNAGAGKSAELNLNQITDEQEFKQIINEIEEHREQIRTFSAEFDQVKTIMPFEETEKANGVFFYKKPMKVVWEFYAPEKNMVILKENRGFIVTPNLKQVQLFSMEQNNRFKFLLAGLGEPLSKFFVEFNVLCFKGEDKSGKFYLFRLSPKDPEMAQIMDNFEVKVSCVNMVPSSTKLVEKTGDITTLTFSQIKINPNIKESVFEYKIPPAYEIIDYRE